MSECVYLCVGVRVQKAACVNVRAWRACLRNPTQTPFIYVPPLILVLILPLFRLKIEPLCEERVGTIVSLYTYPNLRTLTYPNPNPNPQP